MTYTLPLYGMARYPSPPEPPVLIDAPVGDGKGKVSPVPKGVTLGKLTTAPTPPAEAGSLKSQFEPSNHCSAQDGGTCSEPATYCSVAGRRSWILVCAGWAGLG